MATKKSPRGNAEIRRMLLQYFYGRNHNATSVRGKKGSETTISVVRAELKTSAGLSVQEVMSNLRYLISQGWVEEREVTKEVPLRSGTVVPSATKYYGITAAGIDKIEGPGEFTRDPFHGIKIEATGQNIITVGDGNQVNAAYKDVGEALSLLDEAVRACPEITEQDKMNYVSDIQSMQAQLAKPKPNRNVLRTLWSSLEKIVTLDGLFDAVTRVAGVLAPLLAAGSP